MIEMIESPNVKWQRFVESLTYEQRCIAACWLPQRLDSAVNIDKQIKMVKSYLERKTNGNSS